MASGRTWIELPGGRVKLLTGRRGGERSRLERAEKARSTRTPHRPERADWR
ncbi:MAG: hypothetical protein R3F60_21210 [bacterium]